MIKQTKTLLQTLALSIVTITFIGCNSDEKPIEKNTIKAIKVLDLSKTTALKDWAEYPALIHPFKNSELAFELSGKIIKFNYKVGDKLKKGDVIAKLDDTIYRSNLKASKANYEKALADYKRYEKLYKTKTIAIAELERSKQNLDVTKANYDVAKKNFDNTKLIAEFDGVLAQKYIEDFARITAKQKIAVLQDNSKFKVKFYVPENDIVNEKEEITLEKVNNQIDTFVILGKNKDLKYKAKIIDISRKAEDITRTYESTAIFDKPKGVNIFAGMTANVKIIEKNKKTTQIFVPLKAVFSDHSKATFVWIIDKNNKVHKKQIKTGRLEKNSIEIISGLTHTDKIATSGVSLLQESQEIKAYKKLGN